MSEDQLNPFASPISSDAADDAFTHEGDRLATRGERFIGALVDSIVLAIPTRPSSL